MSHFHAQSMAAATGRPFAVEGKGDGVETDGGRTCPICRQPTCACQLEDRLGLAKAVGRLLRGKESGLTAPKGDCRTRPFPGAEKSDEYYTPQHAFELIRRYLPPPPLTVWECAWGTGQLAEWIRAAGYSVVGGPGEDFLATAPPRFDVIVTNPPYSGGNKDKFLERAYSLQRPFALLLPVEALGGGQRNELFRKNGISVVLPSKRIHFDMPHSTSGHCAFNTGWFCWRLDLPGQLTFVEAWW
jgi:hypothetical protein